MSSALLLVENQCFTCFNATGNNVGNTFRNARIVRAFTQLKNTEQQCPWRWLYHTSVAVARDLFSMWQAWVTEGTMNDLLLMC